MFLFKSKLFLYSVIIPYALVILYFLFISSSRFVSESMVGVRQASESGGVPGIAMLIPGVNPGSREDTLYLKEYIQSRDMMLHLDERFNLRSEFESPRFDLLNKLWPNSSIEQFYELYKKRVNVEFNDLTGLLVLNVQAFEPDFSQKINQEIIMQSERFVNEISHRMAREQMDFSERELIKSRERYQNAKSAILEFQNKHKILDPVNQALSLASVGSGLESEITNLEANFKDKQTYLQPGSHELVAIENRISALKEQLKKERDRVASGEGERMNLLAAEFQNIMLDASFAEDAYKLALASVENSRIEASRKIKSLIIIQEPNLPESAYYPRHLYSLVTIGVFLLLFFGIVRLVQETIRDHKE